MRVLVCSLKWSRLWCEQKKRHWDTAAVVSMQMREQDAEKYGGERKRRKGYAEVAKGNTKNYLGNARTCIYTGCRA